MDKGRKNAQPKKMFRLFSWQVGLSAFLFLFGSASLMFVYEKTSHQRAPVSSGMALYDNLRAGQALFADLRFAQAAQKFRAAGYVQTEQRPSSSFATLASLEPFFESFFSYTEQAPASSASTMLQSAAQSIVRGYERVVSVSSDALLGKDGAQSAGALFADAQQEMENARNLLAKVKSAAQESSPVILSRLQLLGAQQDLFMPYLRLLRWVFDPEHPKKFLVVIQNQDIPRSTGGLIDAYGVITIENGSLVRSIFDDVRNLDGQLESNIIPPRQLQNSATAWRMRDANWFLDFPTSASKIASFYKKSGGEEVDGVIAVNKSVVEDLMGTDTILGSGTVALLIEKLAAVPSEDLRVALRALDNALEQKNIMVWLADRTYQKTIIDRAWDGGIARQSPADYTAVTVHAMDDVNASGPVDRDMVKHTEILNNGDSVNTVALEIHRNTRKGGFESYDGSQYYVKLYTPKGSRLIAASGGEEQVIVPQIDYAAEYFMPDEDVNASESTLRTNGDDKIDIFEETEKTVFGTWITLGGPGTKKLLYHYTVPLSAAEIHETFASIFQKQPGADGTVQFSIKPPDGKRFVGSGERGFMGEFSGNFSTDLVFTGTLQ